MGFEVRLSWVQLLTLLSRIISQQVLSLLLNYVCPFWLGMAIRVTNYTKQLPYKEEKLIWLTVLQV